MTEPASQPERGFIVVDPLIDRDLLLEHLEWARTAGHSFRFEPWRDGLTVELLVDIHEWDHVQMLQRPHPEGDHSHPYGAEEFYPDWHDDQPTDHDLVTDLDLVTDHPFEPATFRDAWPGICGYDVNGLPCGFSRAEHSEGGAGDRDRPADR